MSTKRPTPERSSPRLDTRKLLEVINPDLTPFEAFNRLNYNYANRTDSWKADQLKLEAGILERGIYKIPYSVRGSYGRVRLKRETRLAIDLPGGPGTALTQQWRSNSSPELYRVATANWRGVGDTTPFSSLRDNTTDHLIEDMEALRKAAAQGRDEPVIIRGSSWGMTMATLYAATYPEKVAGLVLGLPFLAAQSDVEHNYGKTGTLAQRFPEAFNTFSTALGNTDGREATRMIADELGSSCERRVKAALMTAISWEYARNGETCSLTQEQIDLSRPEMQQLVARARILNYYTSEGFFLPSDGVTAAFSKVPRNIPIIIMANRNDPLCTPDTLQKVQAGLPQAEINVYDANWHWVARENEQPDKGFDNSFVTQGYPYAMGRMAFIVSGRLQERPGLVNYPRLNMGGQ